MAWNRPENGEAASSPLQGKGWASAMKRRGRRFPVVVAGVIVVLGAAIAAWWIFSGGKRGEDAASTQKMLIKDVAKKSSSEAGRAANGAEVATNATAVAAVATNAVEYYRGVRVVRTVVVTNGPYLITKIYTADGKHHRIEDWARPPVGLPSSTDEMLSQLAVHPHGPPIPVSKADQAAFLKSLETPIIPEATDSAEVKAWKRSIVDMRKQMKALIDEGHSFDEVIQEYQRSQQFNEEMRDKARSELKALVDKGDREGAEDYLNTMNQAFSQMGIEEIKMPRSREEAKAAFRAAKGL